MAPPKKVEIQSIPHNYQDWKNIHLSEIRFNDDAVYVGGPLRILVDDEIVYSTAEEDLADV